MTEQGPACSRCGSTEADACPFCVTQIPVFENLDDRQLLKIQRLIRHASFNAGETIIREGDPLRNIYIIRSGKVKVVHYRMTEPEVLVDLLGTGDFYGADSLFIDCDARENLVTLEPTYICMIPSDDIRALIATEPEVALGLLRYYADVNRRYRMMHEIFAIRDAKERIVRFLLAQVELNGSPVVQLTQKELASAISLTPETVNRKLAELKKAGLIQQTGHANIIVSDDLKPSQA